MYRLIFGDCIEEMDKLISEGIIFDAIITDPPYEIGYAEWDGKFNWIEIVKRLKRLTKTNGNIIIFQGWSNVDKTKNILDKEFNLQNWIIYDRIKGRGTRKQLVSTREDILWYCNGDNPTFHKIYSNIPKKTKGMGEKNGQPNRALTNVWYDIPPLVPWSKEKVGHPTQKPIALMERCIKLWTSEGDLILDFTCGSGSTILAAKKLNRRAVGIDNGYCTDEKSKYYGWKWTDVVIDRLNQIDRGVRG